MSYEKHEFEIGLDVDDVMTPCHARLCALASEVLDYYVNPAETPHKLETVLPQEATKRVWEIVDSTPGWCAPEPDPVVVAAIQRLRTIGTVVAITSPHTGGTWMKDRAAWLKDLGFAKDDIYLAAGKFRLPVDVLVDDLGSNLWSWHKRNPRGLPLLWTATHTSVMPGLSITKVDSWDHVFKHALAHKLRWRTLQDARWM